MKEWIFDIFVKADFDIYCMFVSLRIYESHDPFDVVARGNREVV